MLGNHRLGGQAPENMFDAYRFNWLKDMQAKGRIEDNYARQQMRMFPQQVKKEADDLRTARKA